MIIRMGRRVADEVFGYDEGRADEEPGVEIVSRGTSSVTLEMTPLAMREHSAELRGWDRLVDPVLARSIRCTSARLKSKL